MSINNIAEVSTTKTVDSIMGCELHFPPLHQMFLCFHMSSAVRPNSATSEAALQQERTREGLEK